RRLCDTPPTTEGALAALAWVSEVWSRRPLRVGIGGEDGAMRGLVLDAGFGGGVLGPRTPGSPPLRIRRGRTTRFSVVRDGAAPEEHVFVPKPDGKTIHPATDAVRNEVASWQQEVTRLEADVPALVRSVPRPWMFWLWPLRWLQRWRARAHF